MFGQKMEGSGSLALGVLGLCDAVRVGEGSFGVVYQVFQPEYGRRVAVKVLNARLDDETRRRFEGERKTLGALSGHQNVVTLHDTGVSDDGHPFLIMEFLPGGTLTEQCDEQGQMDWKQATAHMAKIAGAVAAAHELGVLHRDIKPENILLSADNEPKLADFGVAHTGQGQTMVTATGIEVVVGTPAHTAPEIFAGVAAGKPADVWALASTFATLVIGRPPFYAHGDGWLHRLAVAVLKESPPDLRRWGVPDELCETIEAALAKDSWERPDAAAFAAALQAVAHTNPATEPSLTPTARAARYDPAADQQATRRRIQPNHPTDHDPNTPPHDPPPAPDIQPSPPTNQPSTTGHNHTIHDQVRPGVDDQLRWPEMADIAKAPRPERNRRGLVGPRKLRGVVVVAALFAATAIAIIVAGGKHGTRPTTLSNATNQISNDRTHSSDVSTSAMAVPAETGQPATYAADALRAAGFAVQVSDRPSAATPAGQVITQTPPPGTAQPKGATVDLIVSTGSPAPSEPAVPDVIGQLTETATAQLQEAGYVVNTAEQTVTRQPKGTIISQQPQPGAAAKTGSTVTLVTSSANGYLKQTEACQAWQATSWSPPAADADSYRTYVAQVAAAYHRFAAVAPATIRPDVADMVQQLQTFLTRLTGDSETNQEAFQTFAASSFFSDFPKVTLAMTDTCWTPAN